MPYEREETEGNIRSGRDVEETHRGSREVATGSGMLGQPMEAEEQGMDPSLQPSQKCHRTPRKLL